MDKFVTSVKKKYRHRIINRESQWPPCQTAKLVRLVLVEKEQGEVHQRGKDATAIKQTPIGYNDLFQVEVGRRPVRKILVEGDAGIGKTTFCTAVSEDWANGRLFQQFELLLLLPLRHKKVASAGSISELLKLLHPSTEVCASVANYLEDEEGEKVLIMADGWDELVQSDRKEGSFMHELLFGNLLSFASVVLTSRPTASAPLHKLPDIDRFVEVNGFNKDNITEYIQSEFPSNQEKACHLLEQLETNPLLESICSIPLNCAIICHLWRTLEEVLPTTMTELYTQVIKNVVFRNIRKIPSYENVQSLARFDAFPDGLQLSWWLLCRFAYDSLWQGKIVFSEDELRVAFQTHGSSFDEKIFSFGLLQSAEPVLDVGHGKSFHFLHLTFQEYLVALFFVDHPADLQLTLLQRHANRDDFNMVWRFFFGIGFRGIHNIKSQMIDFNKAIDMFSPSGKELTLCHCAVEADHVDVTMVQKIKSPYKSLRFGCGPWRPHSVYDCTVVLRFLVEQQCYNPCVEINFSHCHVGDKMIAALAEILASKLGKSQVCELWLGNNDLTDTGVNDLFHRASSAFQNLRTVCLDTNQITAKGISAIALCSINIDTLRLSQNPLGVPGIQKLEAVIVAGKVPKLTQLCLQDCLTEDANTNGELLASLTKALVAHCHSLSSLDLSKNNIGPPGAEALGKAMSKMCHRDSHLSLYLNEGMLGDEGIDVFVRNIEGTCYFSTMELKSNGIHSTGVSFLTEGISCGKFQKFYELVLDDNPLGLSGALAVGRMLCSSQCKFTHVSLSGCHLVSAEGVPKVDCQELDETVAIRNVERQLCELPQVSIDGKLTLEQNDFSGAGVHILAGMVHLCSNLHSIMVNDCRITSDDIVHLFNRIVELKSFGDCRRLQFLSLTNNIISDSGVAALIKHLPTFFPNLTSSSFIKLDGNNVSSTVLKTLSEELKKNKASHTEASKSRITSDGCYNYGDNVDIKEDIFTYTGGARLHGIQPGLVKILEQMTSSVNYFECEIVSSGTLRPAVHIGVGDFEHPLYYLPGSNQDGFGIGYNSDGGMVHFPEARKMYHLPNCSVGDRMGCGVDFSIESPGLMKVFFTRNGEHLFWYTFIIKEPKGGVYPLIGLQHKLDQVRYLGHWHFLPEGIKLLANDQPKPGVVERREKMVNVEETSAHPDDLDISSPEMNKPMLKLFSGKFADCLPICCKPSIKADSVGVIKPGSLFSYVEEVENTDGRWVLLTKEAMQQFCCPDGVESAYVLAYNAEERQELLQDKESSTVSDYLDPFSRVKKLIAQDGCYRFGDTAEVEGDIFTHKDGSSNEPALVKVMEQMNSSHNYFECEIILGSKLPAVGIGVGELFHPLYCMPGWKCNGIGYHSDDGNLYNQKGCGEKYGPTCGVGDRMGCGIDFDSESSDYIDVFFTKNGKQVGDLVSFNKPSTGLYPLIGICNVGDKVRYLDLQHFLVTKEGQESSLKVTEPKVVDENERTSSNNHTVAQRGDLDITTAEVNTSKVKLFTGKYAAGLCIRSKPSFMADSVGVIKPGMCFTYIHEIENIDGKWVILTKEAMQQFGCPDGLESAYVLACNTGTKQQILLEKKNLKQLAAESNEAEMCVSSEGASTNDSGDISCEQQKSQLNLVAESSLTQCETNGTPKEKGGSHDLSSDEEYETPPTTPCKTPPLRIPSLIDAQSENLDGHRLTSSDLAKVLKALWEARSKWYNLGLELGISHGSLDAIKQDNLRVTGDCLSAMLREWLKRVQPPPTWCSLSNALRSPTVNMGELIKELPYGHN